MGDLGMVMVIGTVKKLGNHPVLNPVFSIFIKVSCSFSIMILTLDIVSYAKV